MPTRLRLVDLSHPIVSGMPVPPGLPSPRIEAHLDHVASGHLYGGLAAFEITRCFLVGNTGTTLDSPFHRYPGATDIASLPLEGLVGLPLVVIDVPHGDRSTGPIPAHVPDGIEGAAVLLRTGRARRWGRSAYWRRAPFVDEPLARAFVAAGVALVGIDGPNVDDTSDPVRPAHSVLLRAGVPIAEHLADLSRLPATGARFTAVPAPIRGCASFPVRAFAELPEDGWI